jgi:hypothetical protein
MEREDHRGEPAATGEGDQGLDDPAVAGMETVEVADGDRAGTAELFQAAADSHGRDQRAGGISGKLSRYSCDFSSMFFS